MKEQERRKKGAQKSVKRGFKTSKIFYKNFLRVLKHIFLIFNGHKKHKKHGAACSRCAF
tara:strand:- start:404 stop:580 length:177 start_codon:yes stop_codon:yes gene_type:complete